MASVVQICNRGLQRLGADRISSLADDSRNARACNFAYEPVRDALLRRYKWGFAVTLVQLPVDAAAPIFGKQNSFSLPADSLRILPPNNYDLDWIIRGRTIHTDWGAPLDVLYIKRITDPNTMDTLFQEVLSLKLADELCEEITHSNTKKRLIGSEVKSLLAEAKRVGAYEQISDTLPEDSWVTVRL